MKHKLTLSILFIALLVIPAAMSASSVNLTHEPTQSPTQSHTMIVDPISGHSEITLGGPGNVTTQDCFWVKSGSVWEYICN